VSTTAKRASLAGHPRIWGSNSGRGNSDKRPCDFLTTPCRGRSDTPSETTSVLLLSGLVGWTTAQSADFEPAPMLRAADLLPADLLKGPKHEVRPEVKTDGFMTAFVVVSPFGTFECPDRETLEIRVKGVYSLDKLDEVSRTEAFAKAFAQSAKRKAQAVARVAKDPVGTAKALPAGVARFAKGLGRTGKRAVHKMRADKPKSDTEAEAEEEDERSAKEKVGGPRERPAA
jgi:hypothetical protein